METTPLQNALIISSIIGSIMSSYNTTVAKERTKPINEIRRRIKKFMYKRSRSNTKEFLEAVKYADKAWQNSIKHFAEKKIKIDAVSTVVRLYDLYSYSMSKYANIHEKQIEAYAYNPQLNDIDIELGSYEVADYIIEQLSKHTGIKRKKLNLINKDNK